MLRPKPENNNSNTSSNNTAVTSSYKGYKKARLIEIISSETKETITSARRKRALKMMRGTNNYDPAKEEMRKST